jgi:hypothetical protein
MVAAKRKDWDAAEPGDPDYRLNRNLLSREELQLTFRLAVNGEFNRGEMGFLLSSAVFWGERYSRWLDIAGHTGEVAEVLVDHILGPFRRPRWRAAWLLERFPPSLREAAVNLAGEFISNSTSIEEQQRLKVILRAVTDQSVEATIRTSSDEDLTRDHIARTLLNEFAFENQKTGARGRLSGV